MKSTTDKIYVRYHKYNVQEKAVVQREMESGVFQGKTALMWASSQGRDAVVKILLRAGSDADYYSVNGNFKGNFVVYNISVRIFL